MLKIDELIEKYKDKQENRSESLKQARQYLLNAKNDCIAISKTRTTCVLANILCGNVDQMINSIDELEKTMYILYDKSAIKHVRNIATDIDININTFIEKTKTIDSFLEHFKNNKNIASNEAAIKSFEIFSGDILNAIDNLRLFAKTFTKNENEFCTVDDFVKKVGGVTFKQIKQNDDKFFVK